MQPPDLPTVSTLTAISSNESTNSLPSRRFLFARSRLRNLLPKIHGLFNLSIPNTHVEKVVKGHSFIVCIAPAAVLKGREYKRLRSEICKTVQATIAEVWKANQPWVAPEPYRSEAGSDLVNIVLVLNYLCSRNDLPQIKRKTNQIENSFRKNGLRRVNLNPGLALPEGVLVASRKPKEGREPLSEDVWGQWVLTNNKGQIEPSPHTFDEYSDTNRLVKFGKLCSLNSR